MKKFTLYILLFTGSYYCKGQNAAPANYRPDLFAENIISTPNREWTTTFMPDGKTVYFSRGLSKFYIEYAVFENGKWQEPKVAPFSGMWTETDPFITPDGKGIYFASLRPADQLPTSKPDKNAHIWYAKNLGGNNWSKPELLDTTINNPGVSTWFPSETSNGDFYFHSWGRPGGHGKNDIYVSKHNGDKFSKPLMLPFDTAGYSTQECRIARDNSYMIFISDRPGGFGPTDLYIAFNKDGKWSNPINMGLTFNQPGLAVMAPGLAPDGQTLYFASAYVPTPPSQKQLSNQDIKDQMIKVYNGFWNIFSLPLNLEKLRTQAHWE